MAYSKTTVMGPLLVGIVIYIIIVGRGEGAGNVQATHFRGGSISWKPSDSFSLTYREVIFTFKLGWRLSRIGCDERTITSGTLVGEDARWFCMFGCSGVVASTREKCTEFNLGEDWMFGSNTFKKVFEDDGPIEISYMECCWLTDLVVGAGGEWALTTTLNLGLRSDTGGPNSSPVTAMAPMITLRAGVPDVIDLAVRDSDGDKVTCRLGRHVGECGTICSLFSEFTLDEENCVIRYTPASNTTGKIPVAVMVEDHHRSNDGITMGKKNFKMTDALSSVPVQFIVVLKDPPKLCSEKPQIDTSIPPSIPVKVRPGRNFTFTVTSTPCDVTTSIDDFILIAPIGVRKSPIINVDGVYQTEITWTPEAAQDGSNLICVTGRSSNGVLSEQICITVEVPKATSFCAVVGGSHFITFDKARYNFYGMCKYQLIGTIASSTPGLTPFSVMLSNEETPAAYTAVRIGTLEVIVNNQKVTIDGKRNVYLDGILVNLPIRLRSGLRVEKSGRGINIGISLALRIHIDDGTLSVQLPQIYAGQVEGLCGNNNGEAMDDLTMRGGIKLASNEAEFAASFQIDEEGGRCNNGLQQLRDEPICNESELNKATSQCSIITDTTDQGCFSMCHDVIEPKNFYENCVNVLCQAADDFTALDVLVRAYADACQRESVSVCDWRVQLGISVECEPNSHYERCAPTVPATCADSISIISPTPSDSCIEGCVCNKGYILSGSVCVPESECGCIIDDIYYPKGFTYRTEGCEKQCVCGEGCKKVDPCNRRSNCTKGTDGFHRCIEKQRDRATCKAVTDPHYQTFDGTKFDSMGTCAYIMVRSKRNATKATAFTVISVNEQSPENANATHVKEVHVNFGDGHVLTFLRGPKVILDDKELNPGSSLYGVDVRRVGQFVVADFHFGIVVRWDGVDRLRITAWSPLRYMVEGLCGDFDDNPDNDFAVRPTEENLPDPGSFAESWRVEGYGTEGCFDHPGTEVPQPPCTDLISLAWYQEECRALTDPKGAFSSCHPYVDPVKAARDCVYDLCAYKGNNTIKERTFASYTHDCLEESGRPLEWRDTEGMAQSCINGTFNSCMEQCQPTCSDPTGTLCREKIPNRLGETCVEGCVCAPGLLLSGNECVTPEQCGCVVNGRYEKKGFSFAIADCTQTCVCQGPEDLACGPTPNGCQLNRDRCRQRGDGYFECYTRPRRRATCKAVTDPHYMTFDGLKFDSMGLCAYTMAKSKEGADVTPFKIVAVNERPKNINETVSSVREAYAYIGDDIVVKFTAGPNVSVNGERVLAGTTLFGIEFRMVGRFFVAEFPFGLVIRWDGIDRLRIMAWAVLKGTMEGLCGDFNDDQSNDFTTPDGSIVTEIDEFVNSWIEPGYETDGCDDLPPQPPHFCESDEKLQEHRESCKLLIDPDSPLINCFEIQNPNSTYNDCVFDMCATHGDPAMRERLISSYTEDCREEAVSDEVPPGNLEFRTPEEEELICGGNSHFESCISPCQPTCTDKNTEKCLASDVASDPCVDACVCDDGYVLSGDTCVPESECGCEVDERYVEKGFVYFNRNCTTECNCLGEGEYVCTPRDGCPKGQRCRINDEGARACVDHVRRRATCKAVTDPHYMTFDGVKYDSMGLCAYVMAKTKADADVPPFRIVAVNEKPKNVNDTVSSVKEVFIYIGDDITINLKAGPTVLVNGERVLAGSKYGDIEFRMVGRFFVVEFPFGLVVRWDGIDRLRIMAWAVLKGTMEGLCGDFNDDQSNDFMTPDGTLVTEIGPFVDSWKVDGYDTVGCESPSGDTTPPHFCGTEELLAESRRMCALLTDPDSPLNTCFHITNSTSSFDNCVFDMCATNGDPAMRERIISSYTEDCREDAVSDEVPPGNLEFRTPEEEDALCSENSHFENCVSPCQSTCNDKHGEKCLVSNSAATTCVDTCVCDDGYILSGSTCVPESECGCELNGQYIEKGFVHNNKNCTTQCTCLGEGELVCASTDGCLKGQRCRFNDQGDRACVPHVRRRATCKAVTDPHYQTFDGTKYDSMGTCAYIMVRSKSDAEVERFRVVAVNEAPPVNRSVSHVKEVHIDVGRDFRVSFSAGPVVKINGDVVLPGSKVRYVEIRQVGRFTVAEFDFGLVVRWDGIDRLRVMAWANLKNQVEGLCGEFDDNIVNDFTTPSGRIEPNLERFVRSWRINEFSEPSCYTAPPPGGLDGGNIGDCTNETIHQIYIQKCSQLTDTEGMYSRCHAKVEPIPYYNDCMTDLCALGGETSNYDRIASEYTLDCLEELDRQNTPNITEECPDNMFSQVPMDQCQPTCNDPDASICRSSNLLGDQPVAGCVCNPGLVLSGSKCVTLEECGCLIDGKYRDQGFRYLNKNCDIMCECIGAGDIVCLPTDPCRTTERCTKVNERYQCTPHIRNKATCKAITDPHYKTFDGKTFDSQGSCAYIMARNIAASDAPQFQVTASNERSSSEQATSSVRQVRVNVGDDFELKVARNLKIYINGKQYNPGSIVEGVNIRKIGLFTVLEFDFGLVVRWDGKDRLRVTVWDGLKGKVEGMCGRYNDDMDDDYTMPDGLTTNVMNDFVKSWEIKEHSDKKCGIIEDMPDDCSAADVLASYEDQCRVILQSDGPFAKCHRVVDPDPAYRACVKDLCRTDGDLNMKDRVLSSYTHDCLEFSRGPDAWRADQGMPIPCKANSKYSRCMHQCQPTCSDPDASACKNKLPFLLGDNCVEGCKCNSGFYLSVDRCVPIEKCGCLVDGVYYRRGFKYRDSEDCTRECTCVGQDSFECKDIEDGCLLSERCKKAPGGYYQCMPGTRRRATCKAITDPHYTSFDGLKFDSQGICSYTMVRSKVGSTIDPFIVVAVNEQPLANVSVSNVKEVHIDYRGHRLSMYKGPVAELNGEVVYTGTTESGMKLLKVGRYMSANFDFGLNIRWDGSDRMRIMAMGNLRGQVEGVCGNFNDDPTDDLVNEDVYEDPEEFVNSWKVAGFNDECPNPQADFLVERPIFKCGAQEMIQAEEACSVLINPDGPLKNCKRLADAETVYENCMLDLCAFVGDEQMRERVISDYTEDCRIEGGELDKNWRDEANLTEVSCPPNSHFEPCMAQCQPSCDDLDGSQCRLNDIGDNCVEGCHPDDGFVLSGDEYVSVSQCGCVKDGRYHKSGDVFYTKGCKTLCECNAGVVTCNATRCGREEECAINGIGRLDCVRIETSTCHAWGSTHFSTFDGKTYDLNTQCHYTIVKREPERGNPQSRLESFFLTANILPSSENDKLTVLKTVRLRLPGLGLSIFLRPMAQARV